MPSSFVKTIGKISAVVTLIGGIGGGIYAIENRYMQESEHDKDVLAKSQVYKMKFVELELNVVRMELVMMMGVPEAIRTPSQQNKIEMLRRKQQYLIEHMSY